MTWVYLNPSKCQLYELAGGLVEGSNWDFNFVGIDPLS